MPGVWATSAQHCWHSGRVDLAGAEDWIRAHVEPAGPIETEHERPWATVLRVPLADGVAWFKACAPVQAFEPRLTAELFARHPDLVAEVLGHDEERAWLLLADAGTPIGAFGNPPEMWLAVLPLYAELQRGEAAHADDHLAHGVPDLRVATLPARYDELLGRELPLEREEVDRLRAFAPRFAELCDELAAHGVPETVQHDDLHMANVYAQGDQLRVLDWGDSSISHPFVSLVVTFRFLEEVTKLPPETRGSRGCATPIWNRGAAVSTTCSRSRCASASSRTRSRGCGSATTSRRRTGRVRRAVPVVLRRAIAQTRGSALKDFDGFRSCAR